MQLVEKKSILTVKKRCEYIMGGVLIAVVLISAIAINTNQSKVKAAVSDSKDSEGKNDKDNNKKKYIIVIDPGHGGFDPGKVGINKELEKDINLAIAKKLKKKLEDNNVEVIITREEDVGLYNENDTNKKRTDMKKRIDIINESGADLCVSIHQNSYTSKNVCGAQAFYYSKSKEGEELAKIIQGKIKEVVDVNNKRVAKANDDYYMLLNTKCPSVIVECGFLSNWEEATNLMDDYYQDKVADGISQGIIKYLSND